MGRAVATTVARDAIIIITTSHFRPPLQRRRRRDSRSDSRTPPGTPPARRHHQSQQSRKYRERDSSSRSRSPKEEHATTLRGGAVAGSHVLLAKSGGGAGSTATNATAAARVAAAALVAANAAAAAMAAGSSGGGGGGLLPTPNYAPKIPSLMSLELSTPAAAAPVAEPIQLPSYYNPSIINANRYAEQQQKRKLLWGSKKSENSANKWGNAHFSQDSDGKVASKFMRLMGIKNAGTSGNGDDRAESTNGSAAGEGNRAVRGAAPSGAAGGTKVPTDVQQRQRMFSNMEQQYEMARVRHTHDARREAWFRLPTHILSKKGSGQDSDPLPARL
ncbi:GD17213 [Drosophila simulans]|uniref:GD17213 n=1 Tax=Drosophila simulans TaxID=7240 RepID=B4R579_DROSI|nr:GD17213 [Drosophila simulans]